MSTTSAPAELHARRPIHARLGLRSRMRSFVVGQLVFLLDDRLVTPGQLRRGDKGRIIKLEDDKAWAEFPLGAILHKELVTLGDVGWLYECQDCGGAQNAHSKDCRLDMGADSMHERKKPGLEPGRF